MRPSFLAWIAIVGACNTTGTTAPGTASGAWGTTPSSATSPAAAPVATSGGVSCAEVFDCVGACADEACTDRCLERATGAAHAAAVALGECIASSSCQDADCTAKRCKAAAEACAAAGGTAGDTTGAVAIAPAAPTGDAAAIVGTWATSSGAGGIGYVKWNWGAVRRRYVFAGDGTFTYHSEYWYGNDAPNQWMLVDQRGAWSVSGGEITIAPSASSAVVVDRAGKRIDSVDAPLEQMTYRWQLHFFEGIGETDLILAPTTGTETKRDGAFASNDAFPGSYLFSQTYHPDWQFKPD